MAVVVVAVALPALPVAPLDDGVGVGCPVSVGEGLAGVPVADPVADGVADGLGVVVPAGAVVAAEGDGVGVQATTGTRLFICGYCCTPPAGAVLTMSSRRRPGQSPGCWAW